MKTILWTFGDSFTEGFIKLPKENSPDERESICYPTQIVKRSKLFDSCNNLAERGSNNEMILYQVQKNLDNFHQQDFVIIALSHSTRASKYNSTMDEYVRVVNEEEHTIAKRSPVWQTDMMICWIHNQLRQRNIRHLFISAFEPYSVYSNIYYTELLSMGFINARFVNNTLLDILLSDYCTQESKKIKFTAIDPRDTRIGRTWDYSHNKYITECNHPSPEGHTLIADTLIECLQEYL